MATSTFKETEFGFEALTVTKQESHFSEPNSNSDLILVVEDKKLHVSKVILSVASPVFQRMFEGDFKEKSSNEISLPDKKYKDVLEFLLCIYPSTYKKVGMYNFDSVLPLAHEYQVQQLVDGCVGYALSKLENINQSSWNSPVKYTVHLLLLAETYDLKPLLEKCIEKMTSCKYLTEDGAEHVPEFKMISKDTKYEILYGRMKLLEPRAQGLKAHSSV